MTSDQYQALLTDMARTAGLADSTELLRDGRLRIDDRDALLEHDPRYDEHLLQVRILLGELPPPADESPARALLKANYVAGYGGDCVFSLYPTSDEIVLTLRLPLRDTLSGQELLGRLSEAVAAGMAVWERLAASVAAPAPAGSWSRA